MLTATSRTFAIGLVLALTAVLVRPVEAAPVVTFDGPTAGTSEAPFVGFSTDFSLFNSDEASSTKGTTQTLFDLAFDSKPKDLEQMSFATGFAGFGVEQSSDEFLMAAYALHFGLWEDAIMECSKAVAEGKECDVTSFAEGVTPMSIPEPATLLLMGLGVAAAVRQRRRQRHA